MSNEENIQAIGVLHVDCQTPRGSTMVVLLVRTHTDIQYFAIDHQLAAVLSTALGQAATEAKANALSSMQ
jgi:hypothetical protein